MDKDMHQGHEPEHVDLTQLEGEPGARVDPLFERQTDDAQFAGRWFRVRLHSDTPVRSPAGTATAVLKLVFAAGLPAAGMAAGGRAMGVAAWLTLTLAALMFMVVGAVGLFLILRIEPSPHAQPEITSDQSEAKGGGANLQANCGETAESRSRHHTEHTDPIPSHRALQPPRHR